MPRDPRKECFPGGAVNSSIVGKLIYLANGAEMTKPFLRPHALLLEEIAVQWTFLYGIPPSREKIQALYRDAVHAARRTSSAGVPPRRQQCPFLHLPKGAIDSTAIPPKPIPRSFRRGTSS